MNITDEDKQARLLGEAAMNLILKRQKVSVDSLIQELNLQATDVKDPDRELLITDTCLWLRDYKRPGASSSTRFRTSQELEQSNVSDAQLIVISSDTSKSETEF